MRRDWIAGWSWLVSAVLLACAPAAAVEVAAVENSAPEGVPPSNHSETEGGHGPGHSGVQIVSFKWHHVTAPYIIALWIFVSWISKMGT